MDIYSIYILYIYIVVCTDLRQGAAFTGRCGYSGDIRELSWCNGSTLGRNTRHEGSNPTLGKIFHIFITPTTHI